MQNDRLVLVMRPQIAPISGAVLGLHFYLIANPSVKKGFQGYTVNERASDHVAWSTSLKGLLEQAPQDAMLIDEASYLSSLAFAD